MPDDSKAAIAEEYGADSLEAMLHDGRAPYLHMVRQVPLESPVTIRQFRREWLSAVQFLTSGLNAEIRGIDTSGAITYWARITTGYLDENKWGYSLAVSKNTLLSPAINRIEIIAHEIAHLQQFFEKYVKTGKRPSEEEVRLHRKFDFLDHGENWQKHYETFYAKLKAANIVDTGSEYEKHAAMLLEKRRQAWADPEWRDGYKARMKDGQDKTRKKAKPKPSSTGRVKSHRRRTEKGKSVTVHGYQRKPRKK